MARPSPTQRRNKPAIKADKLLSTLRQQIVTGEFAPGQRLPTQLELMKRFDVGKSTTQRAMDTLTAEGFLDPRGVAGTFVTEQPPHLHRIGLVFPWTQAEMIYSSFYAGLQQEAQRLRAGAASQFRIFYGVGQGGVGSEADVLVADVAAGRLGGVIFGVHPGAMLGRLQAARPGLPIVAITQEPPPGVRGIGPDLQQFRQQALQYLAAHGRRRVSWITLLPPSDSDRTAELATLAATHGLQSKNYWNQHLDPHAAPTARTTIPCLLHLPPEDRPDAMIIEDDNLVTEVQNGLLAAGVRVPEELTVVAACNFPYPPLRKLPLTWLGFDLNELMRRSLDALAATRDRKPFPATTLIPSRFEAVAPAAVTAPP